MFDEWEENEDINEAWTAVQEAVNNTTPEDWETE